METEEAKTIALDMQAAYRQLRAMEDIYLERKFVHGNYVKIADDEYEDTLDSGITDLIQVLEQEGVASDANGGQEGLYAAMTGFVELCQNRVMKCRDTLLDLLTGDSEEAKEWRQFAKERVWNKNMNVLMDEFNESFREVQEKFELIRDRVERGFPAFTMEVI